MTDQDFATEWNYCNFVSEVAASAGIGFKEAIRRAKRLQREGVYLKNLPVNKGANPFVPTQKQIKQTTERIQYEGFTIQYTDKKATPWSELTRCTRSIWAQPGPVEPQEIGNTPRKSSDASRAA